MFRMLLLVCGLAMVGCGDDAVVQAPPPPAPSGPATPAGPAPAKTRAAANAAEVIGGWTPAPNWERQRRIDGRDPFYSFIDELIATLRKEAEERAASEEPIIEEVLLPEQRYAVSTFKLIALITNTSIPKALLLAPDGNTYKLSTGDPIGNRSGVIVDIRRNEIEILQGEGLESSQNLEDATERVIIRLHPENPRGVLNCAINGKTCGGITPVSRSNSGR